MEIALGVRELLPVKSILEQYRLSGQAELSTDVLFDLREHFLSLARIQLNFDNHRLSVMETLVIALSIVNRSKFQRAEILGISVNTLQGYERRAQEKLETHCKLMTVCKSIQLKIIEIIL